jgi:hypothetical protein
LHDEKFPLFRRGPDDGAAQTRIPAKILHVFPESGDEKKKEIVRRCNYHRRLRRRRKRQYHAARAVLGKLIFTSAAGAGEAG